MSLAVKSATGSTLVLLLAACSVESPVEVVPEPYSNEAEVLFQQEAVLRYSLDELDREEQLRRELLNPSAAPSEGEQQ